MGDHGKFYAPKELVGLFREKIIPKAYMITPNQFEAEQLTNMVISDEKIAFEVIEKLHELGPKVVIISSCIFEHEKSTIFLFGS